ncbi:hypothetical protein RJ639_041103 [Escallonia herrerae]|uniref:RING-type domain-containing protein n=1 Tax=Escallonia herrerae TaxID=1293975 RepID=A0AA88WGK2_9ASTE|nr:hypothetical protein RJ639_041103 [Escallonia herrerae]
MGNKLGRRRQVVDDKYTRPQGLYQHKDVDHKKLRKLILDSKLAPCYPGDDDCACDLEECPICFLVCAFRLLFLPLAPSYCVKSERFCTIESDSFCIGNPSNGNYYYPSLNRSRCCTKGICTECFLQMKTPNSTRPTQCPFCKTLHYAVEYRGVKTKEEKGIEQIEEQRVIEAKIRMRQQELQDEEDRMQKRLDTSSSSITVAPGEVEYSSIAVPSYAVEGEEIVSSQNSRAASTLRQPLLPRQNRDDDFDLDLEDIMVMEAIWLSIQEDGKPRHPVYSEAAPSEQYLLEDHHHHVSAAMAPVAESSSSPSGGLACAIAALAERQQGGGESSSNHSANIAAYNMLPGCSRFSNREEHLTQNYLPSGSSLEVSPDSRLAMTREDREWGVDHISEMAEVGTSYAGSDAAEDAGRNTSFPQEDEVESSFQTGTVPIVPESFEEQMMLAMAVSLAEARARINAPGVAWH